MNFSLLLLFGILLFILFIGIVFLQIILAKRENKYLGLILPAICFLLSLIFPLNFAVFGRVEMLSTAFQLFLVFLLSNIPTLILLGIYWACRQKYRSQNQMKKMNIQDLH